MKRQVHQTVHGPVKGSTACPLDFEWGGLNSLVRPPKEVVLSLKWLCETPLSFLCLRSCQCAIRRPHKSDPFPLVSVQHRGGLTVRHVGVAQVQGRVFHCLVSAYVNVLNG